jgi:hypothetical protein
MVMIDGVSELMIELRFNDKPSSRKVFTHRQARIVEALVGAAHHAFSKGIV